MNRMVSLLLAGSFFLGGLGTGRVRSGVAVNGVPIGGMPYAAATEAVRSTLSRIPLTIHSPAGDFSLPIDYCDGAEELVKHARRGEYTLELRRECVLLEDFLEEVCKKNARHAQNAELTFDGTFTYTPEVYGVACDYHTLLEDAMSALKGQKSEVSLTCRPVTPNITEEMLRARTRPLSSFSTNFDASKKPRTHNIALAAERISGTVLAGGEEFSFNEVVGKRTKENGFEDAAVILDGEFVQGVGGGVCQASTTLFGAALRAGMLVTESRPHSLSVGYVPPSEDAMVSEMSDLKFVNPYAYPVYIAGEVRNNTLNFKFYGMPDGRRYEVESRVLLVLEPPPAREIEGAEDRVLRAARQGYSSESWLVVYEGNREISRTRIRRDTYACVQEIREVAPEKRPEGPSLEVPNEPSAEPPLSFGEQNPALASP